MKKAKIKHEDESVTIEKECFGKKYRYVVYFQGDYAIFVGESGDGSMVILPDPENLNGKLEYWAKW